MARDQVYPIERYKGVLTAGRDGLAEAVAASIDVDRLIKLGLTSITTQPALRECSPESIYLALLEAGSLGLEPTGVLGHAYLVPRWNGKKGTKEAHFQVGYRGLIRLALRSGKYDHIEARCVFAADDFCYAYGLHPILEHTPGGGPQTYDLMDYVYAIAWPKNGPPVFEVLDKATVQKVRQSSAAKDSGPWVTWPLEMARKTVVRRLAKYLELTLEAEAAIGHDDSVEIGEGLPLAAFDPGKPGTVPLVQFDHGPTGADELAGALGLPLESAESYPDDLTADLWGGERLPEGYDVEEPNPGWYRPVFDGHPITPANLRRDGVMEAIAAHIHERVAQQATEPATQKPPQPAPEDTGEPSAATPAPPPAPGPDDAPATPEAAYVCEDCGREFASPQGLGGHKRSCSGKAEAAAGDDATDTRDGLLAQLFATYKRKGWGVNDQQTFQDRALPLARWPDCWNATTGRVELARCPEAALRGLLSDVETTP